MFPQTHSSASDAPIQQYPALGQLLNGVHALLKTDLPGTRPLQYANLENKIQVRADTRRRPKSTWISLVLPFRI